MAKVQTVYAKPRLFANACLPFFIHTLAIPGGSSNREEVINWRTALMFVEDHTAISHLYSECETRSIAKKSREF